MSNNDEGIRMVKMACNQIESLCPQVINAALTLAARTDSAVAQENMEAFRSVKFTKKYDRFKKYVYLYVYLLKIKQ